MAQERILLIDNDRRDLRSWSKVLRSAGYEVQEASSEDAARKHLTQGGFDLAVVDLHLQDGDDEKDTSGLRIARDHGDSLPFIILTGKPSLKLQRESLRGLKPLAADFIAKSDGADTLIQAVRDAIRPKIFISHGHDEGTLAMVTRFLEGVGTKPIVLQQQPLAGHSILEAFEKYSHVAFAIILVTADDEGHRKGEGALKPRARQNVIFELGYFLARLGRDRVLVLYKPEGEPIEWPSNFHGILYREMEWGGAWRDDLQRDLHAAGIALR